MKIRKPITPNSDQKRTLRPYAVDSPFGLSTASDKPISRENAVDSPKGLFNSQRPTLTNSALWKSLSIALLHLLSTALFTCRHISGICNVVSLTLHQISYYLLRWVKKLYKQDFTLSPHKCNLTPYFVCVGLILIYALRETTTNFHI